MNHFDFPRTCVKPCMFKPLEDSALYYTTKTAPKSVNLPTLTAIKSVNLHTSKNGLSEQFQTNKFTLWQISAFRKFKTQTISKKKWNVFILFISLKENSKHISKNFRDHYVFKFQLSLIKWFTYKQSTFRKFKKI